MSTEQSDCRANARKFIAYAKESSFSNPETARCYLIFAIGYICEDKDNIDGETWRELHNVMNMLGDCALSRELYHILDEDG